MKCFLQRHRPTLMIPCRELIIAAGATWASFRHDGEVLYAARTVDEVDRLAGCLEQLLAARVASRFALSGGAAFSFEFEGWPRYWFEPASGPAHSVAEADLLDVCRWLQLASGRPLGTIGDDFDTLEVEAGADRIALRDRDLSISLDRHAAQALQSALLAAASFTGGAVHTPIQQDCWVEFGGNVVWPCIYDSSEKFCSLSFSSCLQVACTLDAALGLLNNQPAGPQA